MGDFRFTGGKEWRERETVEETEQQQQQTYTNKVE